MKHISELVNNMSMSDVVDYLIEMDAAFVLTNEGIDKLKADAVRESEKSKEVADWEALNYANKLERENL